MFEQLARGHRQALLSCSPDHLNAEDGVTPKLKEIIFDADRIGPQQLLPDVEQRCFDVIARPNEITSPLCVRSGAGRRARSSLPLEVFGKCCCITQTDGTM